MLHEVTGIPVFLPMPACMLTWALW